MGAEGNTVIGRAKFGGNRVDFFDVALEGAQLVDEDFAYDLPEEMAERLRTRGSTSEFTLGVRPENIEMAADSAPGQTFSATVDVREPVGSDNYLYLRLGGTEVTMRVAGKVKPEEGSTIEITIDDEDLHVFDGDTGENLLVDSETTESAATVESATQVGEAD